MSVAPPSYSIKDKASQSPPPYTPYPLPEPVQQYTGHVTQAYPQQNGYPQPIYPGQSAIQTPAAQYNHPYNHSSYNSSGQVTYVPFANYPSSMPVLTDPEIIKGYIVSCLVLCPNCKHIGYSKVASKYNIFLLIIGIILIPVYFLGLLIIFNATERVHLCSKCSTEIARKKRCC